MKKVILILAISTSAIFAAESGTIFAIKSGKVDYKISGKNSLGGMGSMEVIGKKRVIFDNYGRNYLEELSQVQKQTIMGKSEVKKEHKLTYRNGVVLYAVDFKNKKITRMVNNLIALVNPKSKEPIEKQIENNLKKFGAKKIGTDKVLGKSCDVWEMMGVKQCLYKGVPLKIETNLMGLKQSEVATKAEFDISLDKNAFNLPDFPIYSGSMESMMSGVAPKQIDKSKLEQMDKEANSNAINQSNQLTAAAKKIQEKQAQNPNKKLTSQDMQDAVIEAMGGEKAMVEQMKAQILQAANIDALNGIKECYNNSNSAKEANSCNDKYKSKLGGDIENFSSWNDNIKKEVINEIEAFKKAIPCVKDAKSLKAIETCMSY
jgi:hypothetical protein